jgi:CHAT domain-containing protein/Tfp pilus assembly protein PilF
VRSLAGNLSFLVLAGLLYGLPTPIFAQPVDPRLEAAEVLYRQEGAEKALPKFESLVVEFENKQQEISAATARHFIGECHWRLGNYEDSRRNLELALSARRVLNDQLGQGKTLNVLGLLEWHIGNYDQAIANFRSASEVGRALGNPRLEGATLNNLSLVFDELGDYQTSLEQYKLVLEIYANADFPRGEGDTLGNIGGVYLLLGQYREALDFYQQALAISEHLESKPAMSQDHGNIAFSYLGLGEIETAINHFDQAIQLAEETGMQQDIAFLLRGKGNAQIRNGRLDQGLESHRVAVQIYEQIGMQAGLLEALHDMGKLHLSLGDPSSAESYFNQAIEVARDIGLARGITLNLIALGDLNYRREQFSDAATFYQRARQRAAQSGEQGHLIESLLGLGYSHRELNRINEADAETSEALSIARKVGARQMEAEALFALAELARIRGDAADSIAGFESAEAILADTGDPNLLWRIHFGRAMSQEALGDKEAAVESLIQAVTLIESVREQLREDRFRSGYVQDKYQVYIELVRLQLELQRMEDAFATAEQLRARSFVKQVRLARSTAMSEEERRLEAELRERIIQLRRALEQEETQPLAEQRQLALNTFSAELLAAERNYQVFLDDHGQDSLPDLPDAAIPISSEIRSRLGNDEILLEYLIGQNQLIIFALSNNEMLALTTQAYQNDIRTRVELLRDLISRPGDDQWLIPAAGLAEILIKPLEDAGWLDRAHHIYLVPHGILNYLPFSLLPRQDAEDQQLLFEKYALSYLPTAIALTSDAIIDSGSPNLLAMAPAQSRLRYAPEEARSINAIFKPNSQMFVGDTATESRFKELAGEYRMLHLATHGYFNKLNPMFSGLQLESDASNDGRLDVHEVLRLRLNADLVTLSACETALGSGYFSEVPAGDEFVSLTRAFLSVVGESLIDTLWRVDDRSSVQLMNQFYKRLHQSGAEKDKSAALAVAQQQLRSTNGYEHPYYWAPFALIGNTGQTSVEQIRVSEVTL